MERSTSWSVTINNPTPEDEECIALARQKGWMVEGQLEKGENGTPHYQLMVKTPQARFSALKKAFPRGHIEVARNSAALKQYVTKEETRLAPLSSQSSMYPSLSKFWDLLYDELSEITKCPAEDYDWYSMVNESQVKLYYNQAVRELIAKGYVVETIAVNPQTKTAFLNFAKEIFFRCWKTRQTDRQTQRVQIPTTKVEDEDINNANDESESRNEGDGDDESEGSVDETEDDNSETEGEQESDYSSEISYESDE